MPATRRPPRRRAADVTQQDEEPALQRVRRIGGGGHVRLEELPHAPEPRGIVHVEHAPQGLLVLSVVRARGAGLEVGQPPERSPAAARAGVDVLELDARLPQERGEIDVAAALARHVAEVLRQGAVPEPQGLLHVVEHRLARHLVELDGAAARQLREAALDLPLHAATRPTEDGAEPRVEAEPAVRSPDEVEDGAALLVVPAPKTAAELLKEEERALGRPQEEQRVHIREVDPLVEDVDAEQDAEPSVAQAGEGGVALRRGRLSGHRPPGNAGALEAVGHEVGVRHVDAEAQGTHGGDVGDLVAKLPQDVGHQPVVTGVDVAELGDVVSAPDEGDVV